MKVFLLALGFIAVSAASAQDSWKVLLNGKAVLSASTENEEKNRITVKASDLKKKQDFQVIYTEQPKEKGWDRTIMAVAENDHELSRQETGKFKIKNALLESFFKKSKTIRIYTVSLPADPAKRAVIRVRRVHLCTLVLKS